MTESVAVWLLARASEVAKSQSIQAQKGALMRWCVWVWLRSLQPSQQKPKIGMWLCREDPWRGLLSNGADPRDIHGRPIWFLTILCQQKQSSPCVIPGTWNLFLYREKETLKMWLSKWSWDGRLPWIIWVAPIKLDRSLKIRKPFLLCQGICACGRTIREMWWGCL